MLTDRELFESAVATLNEVGSRLEESEALVERYKKMYGDVCDREHIYNYECAHCEVERLRNKIMEVNAICRGTHSQFIDTNEDIDLWGIQQITDSERGKI